MFNTIDLGNILNYASKIQMYVKRYGPSLWYLIYQADHRMRLENMERIRRRGELERSNALAAGGTHTFDPGRPWNWVWKQSTYDGTF